MLTKFCRHFFQLWLVIYGLGFQMGGFAQNIPPKTSPAKYVNDLVGLLKAEEVQLLEIKLKKYFDSTSTQIAIVIIQKLEGYSINDYAQKLAETWGIGQKGKDNGLLILVSKDDRKMKIAVGYGLEAKITDLTAKQIIDNQLVPNFKLQNYYQGFELATNEIIRHLKGEFVAEANSTQKSTANQGYDFWDAFIFMGLIGIFLLIIQVGLYLPLIPAMLLQEKWDKDKVNQWISLPISIFVFMFALWVLELISLLIIDEFKFSWGLAIESGFLQYVIALPFGVLFYNLSASSKSKTFSNQKKKSWGGSGSTTIITNSYSDYSKSYSDYKDYSDKSSYSDSYSDSSWGGGSFGGGGASGDW